MAKYFSPTAISFHQAHLAYHKTLIHLIMYFNFVDIQVRQYRTYTNEWYIITHPKPASLESGKNRRPMLTLLITNNICYTYQIIPYSHVVNVHTVTLYNQSRFLKKLVSSST